MQEGDLDVELHTTRIDNIGRLYGGFAELRDSLRSQIGEAERARKEAEVSRAEAMEMTNYLQETAEEYSEIMQDCAAGDLTQRMEEDGENEAMDQIAAEFNDMIGELEKTTGQLKSYVDEVEAAGAEVEQSANTVRQASEEVADSIQTISDDAYDQKERLRSVSETMDGVASRLEEMAEHHPDLDVADSLEEIRSIAADVEETADRSGSTMAEAENVAGAAEEQAAELNEVSERAHDLQRYAQPLRDILNRFETEAEHEFVFSVGPTGGGTGATADEDEE
jgi:methyl-accepting chemotaxis protein